jgi:hypothetical protein
MDISDHSHQNIAAAAVALWRQQGRPSGRDDEIWLAAERQCYPNLDLERSKRDRVALADPRFAFNRSSSNLMAELDERFSGPTGRETTSL